MEFQINTYTWGGMALVTFEKTYTFVVGWHLGAFEIISSIVLGWRHLRKTYTFVAGRCLSFEINTSLVLGHH